MKLQRQIVIMASPVLFSTGASPTSTVSRNLVEFKAGKMELRDKMVHPIKKQGIVYLHQSSDDNLMHFCWKDRSTGEVVDDLILFPDDCEFKRVKECTTGRVYVLKLKTSNKKLFFWMQEAQTNKDEEYCRKINDLLNNPPRSSSDMSASDRDLQSILGGMTQEQMAQLLGSNGMLNTNLASLLNSATARSPSSNSGASASSTMSTTQSAPHSASSISSNTTGAANTTRQPDLSVNDLRELMTGFEGSESELNSLMAAAMDAGVVGTDSAQSRETRAPVDLSKAVNSESLAHLLSDQEFLKQIEQHLPPVHQITHDNIEPLTDDKRKELFQSTVRSQQFRSALSQFCAALNSGQLGPLMSQFGLSSACVDAANRGNIEAFVSALEEDSKSKKSSTSSSTPKDSSSSSADKKKTDDKPK